MRRRAFASSILALGLAACGGRDEVWSQPPAAVAAHALEDAAVLVDVSANRALVLPVNADLTLDPASVPIGRGFASSAVTPDRQKLLVLSHGDVPRVKSTDEAPRLSVLHGGSDPGLAFDYPLGDPLSGLALDPESRFAVVYPSLADSAFVENPNELSVIDLTAAPGDLNPVPLTLRSFGGRPQSFAFSPTLGIPGGARRLLVVLTDRDLGLIDLSAPEKGDITIRPSSGETLAPAQVAFSDGDPAVADDARIAVRLEGDSSVVLVDMAPSSPGATAHDFRPLPNLVFAGGVPSDIAFVNTDGGLRLAALVPSKSALTLVDPATGIASSVALGAPFEHLSIVTKVVGATESGADVALLWSPSSTRVAFVALGSTVGKPYKSVEELQLEQPISAVYDVPSPNQRLKILASPAGDSFFVLDLVARTASPILASSGASLDVAPDGRRAWLRAPSQPAIAALDLTSLHPKNLILSQPVSAAFDIARRGSGRALVALHASTDYGITVLDAQAPELETAVSYASVLLGGLR